MLDNLKNSYDLFEIFKAHSRTGSSGVLSIKWNEHDISIILSEGRIIGVDSPNNRLSKIVLDRAGLNESEIKSLPKGSVFIKNYQELLSQTVGLLPHELEKIQRSVENEELQKLKSFTEGDFEFQLSIPDSSRNFLINISAGQFVLDLVQNGFRIAIPEEKEEEEVIADVEPLVQVKPQITEKKAKEPTKSEYLKAPTTKTFFRMVNYHSLTPDGVKILYFTSGVFLALFAGWRMPVMFSELLVALSELLKI